jgi:hypothetical protein
VQVLFWAVSYCPSFEAAKKKDTTINLFDEINSKSWTKDYALQISNNKGGVSPYTLWPCHFTFKCILRPKEELWKLKIFHHAEI